MLLLDSPRHSPGLDRDLGREVHKAEWKVKEQKLQDDIKTLREKLLLLVRRGGLLGYVNHRVLHVSSNRHVICQLFDLTHYIRSKHGLLSLFSVTVLVLHQCDTQ